MKRISRLSVLAVVAVVALVLGSFGTATAGPVLSKAKIKSIASKVVKKQAPTLSVASATNATTATNATNLNGQPASAYQNASYRYSLPQGGAPSATKTYNFPGLPSGNYLATFSLLTSAAVNTNVACYLSPSASSSTGRFYGMGTYANGLSTPSAAGNLAITGGSAPQLYCYALGAGGNWSIYSGTDYPSIVTFTKVDSIQTLGTARATAGDRSGPGA
jgi:hypothetical protein